MCLAPLVLLGWMLTMYPNQYHTTNLNGGLLEVQTCERGAGMDLKMSTSGLYSMQMQYGFSRELAGLVVTLTPKAGGGYADVLPAELQSKLNFSLGFQVLVGRDRWRAGVEYWHLSNAGLGEKNDGLDLLTMQAGWTF